VVRDFLASPVLVVTEGEPRVVKQCSVGCHFVRPDSIAADLVALETRTRLAGRGRKAKQVAPGADHSKRNCKPTRSRPRVPVFQC